MKKFLKRYRHLTALLAIGLVAVLGLYLGTLSAAQALLIVGLWQLLELAMSKQRGVCFAVTLSEAQVAEFEDILRAISKKWKNIEGLPEEVGKLQKQVDGLRRTSLNGNAGTNSIRWIGNLPFVPDECAKFLSSMFIYEASRIKGALETAFPDESKRKHMLSVATSNLGAEYRAGGALGTADIPLPTVYVPVIVELVFAYGAARNYATVFPLGSGQVKLPRLKAGEDDFGYLGAGTGGIGQNVPQKEVAAELVTFNANKGGGLIRIPIELEEDTFIPFGQFLARYIARQFAKMEDKTLFLADGTVLYANQTGVGPYCVANPDYLQQLAAGKVKPTDATLNDFRALRTKINPAVFFGMTAGRQSAAAYYMATTMEALLVTFNTLNQPLIYRPQTGSQPATLDGFPIHWIGVSQPYSTNAQPGSFLAFFGDLSFWYLGERGQPRVEVSRHYFFNTDELAMRALERIDVEPMAIDAMAALQTANA